MRGSLKHVAGSILVALPLALLPLPDGGAVRAEPLRVAVVSDLNGSYGSRHYSRIVRQSVDSLVTLRPNLVISTGDMVAGQRPSPPLERDAVEEMWSAFHHAVTDPLARAGIPLAVTPGNHDASAYSAFRLERELYRRQWAGRAESLTMLDREHYPFYYAFLAGEVLFVSLDATRVGILPEDQKRWLERILSDHGSRFRHRVIFSHLPLFPFSQGRETEVLADPELEQLIRSHHVDIYLSGHHHAFYPGYHGGVRYVSQACLGAGPRVLLGDEQPSAPAVTWLVFDGADITVKGLVAGELERPIDLRTLPAQITSTAGTLVREDLRPSVQASTDGALPSSQLTVSRSSER